MSAFEKTAERAVIRLSGEDRRSFLQGLITQDIEKLSQQNAIFAALLTPQGKILFDFFVAESGDDFLIDCRADAADSLAKRLMLYKLRAKIAIVRENDLGVETSPDKPDGKYVAVYEDPRLAALGYRAVSTGASRPDSDYHARRITAGVPEWGADFRSDEVFPMDVNYDLMNGVDYKKGCFIGQEVASRMKRKGEVRKRTLIAEFDGSAPEIGTPVMAGPSTLGNVMSGAEGVALTLIRLDRWEKANDAGEAIRCEDRPLRLSLPAYLEQV